MPNDKIKNIQYAPAMLSKPGGKKTKEITLTLP